MCEANDDSTDTTLSPAEALHDTTMVDDDGAL